MSKPEPLKNQIIVGVAVTVLGGVALAAVTGLWPAASNLLWSVWEYVRHFPVYLGQEVRVPRWWYWLLLITFVLALLGAGVLLVAVLKEKRSPPDYYAFTRMDYFGVEWRWQWRNGEPKEVWCHCWCGRPMLYRDHPYDWGAHAFTCTQPNHATLDRRESMRTTVQLVTHEILHRAETGAWRSLT